MGDVSLPEDFYNKSDKVKYPPQDLDQIYVTPARKKSPLGIPDCLSISEEKWNNIESVIRLYIDKALDERSGLDSKISEWQLALHGLPESNRDLPYDGACSLRDTITPAHTRTIQFAIKRTILVEPYWIATVRGNKEQELLLQDVANDISRHELNFEGVVGASSALATENGFCIMIPEWQRNIKTEIDYEIYENAEAFKEKYPDAESTGLTEAQYKRKIQDIKDDVKDQGYHECEYKYDIVEEGPIVHCVGPTDFVKYPFSAPSIELSVLVAYRMYKVFDDIVRLERDGIYKNASRLKAAYAQSLDNVDAAKEVQESQAGLDQTPLLETYKIKNYSLYKGLIRLDINDEGLERDYEFVYAFDERVLLRLAPYSINYCKRNFIPTYVLKKPNSFLGWSVPEMVENPQSVMDALLRQIIDNNTISNVPTFVMSKNDYDQLERLRDGKKFYPGKIWGLTQGSMFQQLRTNPLDTASYLNLLRFIAQTGEMSDGVSRALAGQSIPDDPTAPGVKTALLVQQSNFFVNEYINNMRPAYRELIKFVIKLYRQRLKNKELNISRTDENGIIRSAAVTRDMLDIPEYSFDLKNQKVDDNQSSRQQESRSDLELLMAMPIVNQNPLAVRIMVRNFLIRTGRYTLDEINEIINSQEKIIAGLQDAYRDTLAAQQAQTRMGDIQNMVSGVGEQASTRQEAMLRSQPSQTPNGPAPAA